MQNIYKFVKKVSNKKGKKILKHAEVSGRVFEMKGRKGDKTL